MKNINRRSFIKNSVIGALIPVFYNKQTLLGFGTLTQQMMVNDNVLVVIQLNGGNDGLNTIIPVNQYSKYQAARTNIAINEKKLITVPQSEKIGLHPSLLEFGQFMKEGKAAIVQDVGYPQPNFSHFRATDIWNTGSSSTEVLESGWAGRYLSVDHPNYPKDYPNTNYPDPLAIQIGSSISPALQGPFESMGFAITNPNDFYNLVSNEQEEAPNTLAGKELAHIRMVSSNSNKYANTIKSAASKVTTQKEYPNESLASQLKIVARLIAGGLKTKIYYVRLSGFDNHSNQVVATDTSTGTHANLLQNVSKAIQAFQNDLKTLGVADKVLGMTYSEFGRRIKSNGSSGTDHGAAAPMLFFGEKVNPRYFGNPTDLPTVANSNDNITMQYDFRSVYASVLKYWFCVDDAVIKQVLFQNFQTLEIVSPVHCGLVTANEPVNEKSRLTNFPNPFSSLTTFGFRAMGGHCSIQIFNMKGNEVLVPIDGYYDEGRHETPLDLSALPKGIYLTRFQNENYQEIRRIIKL